MKFSKLNILTIDELKKLDFPGSELKIEKKIGDEAEYESFITSYYSEGLKIYGYLMVPKCHPPGRITTERFAAANDDQKHPVIIFNRGYVPEGEFQSERQYVRYMAYLAKAGYVVFKSDYRGHGKSEGEVENLIESGYAIDVLNAISSVKRLPNIDANRIGIWGHSMGGGISLKVMLVNPEIKAGVLWASSPSSYLEILKKWSDPKFLGSLSQQDRERRLKIINSLIAQLGDPDKNSEEYLKISPATYLKDLQTPLQLHHGLLDDKVDVIIAKEFKETLEKLGKRVELFLYEGGDHNFTGKEFDQAMERSIEFFGKYLYLR